MNEIMRRLLALPEQASTYAKEVDYLHYFTISVTMFGAFGVFAVAFFFLLRYQRKTYDQLTPKVKAPLWLEAGFITSLLGLFILIWVIGFTQYQRIQEPPEDALTVYVTGKQWMWKFAYPQGPSSVGVLYVPAFKPIKLIITSRDVIHSFFVPAFRMKRDAVPGTYTATWFEATRVGTFPIRCAEYCGAQHSLMLGDVVVLEPRDFERWLADSHAPIAEAIPKDREELGGNPTFAADQREALVSKGERMAADHGCLRCHSIDGTPHIGPTWTGLFGSERRFSDGSTEVANEAYITQSMMDPALKVVAGFQPVMPSYHGKIDPAETAAIVEFIKTLHPNDPRASHPNPLPVGGVIRP